MWGIVILFLTAAISVPLIINKAQKPWDSPAFAAVAERQGWHRVPCVMTTHGQHVGECFFLTTEPHTWEELAVLPRNDKWLDRWRGVIMVHIGFPGENSFGETFGETNVFGDPDMISAFKQSLTSSR